MNSILENSLLGMQTDESSFDFLNFDQDLNPFLEAPFCLERNAASTVEPTL